MTQYRVWRDYKQDTETNDGKEYTGSGPGDAAALFGRAQFQELQHIDPGGVFVRDLTTGIVSRFLLQTVIGIRATECHMPKDFNDEWKLWGAAAPSGNREPGEDKA